MTTKSLSETDNFADQKTPDLATDFALQMKNAVDVQFIDTNLYQSKELRQPTLAVGGFGGQIVAQALNASWDTVPEDFVIHSSHTYFISACDVKIPVLYNIQRVRDGKSFATRIVNATQKGKNICICSFSFTKPETVNPLKHQEQMPDVPDPETLPTDIQVLQKAIDNVKHISKGVKFRAVNKLHDMQPIEYRPTVVFTDEEVASGYTKPDTTQRRWFKTKGPLNDDMRLHACAIAYASDNEFLSTAGASHGQTFKTEGVLLVTSLDHTIWFHMLARADEWLLYDTYSPRTLDGRGLVFGKIYTRDGVLVATTAQEGLMRLSASEREKHLKLQAELQKDLLQNLQSSKL